MPAAPAARSGDLPLTGAQAGVWYAQRLDPANPIYTIAEYVRVDGALDPVTFEAALRQVVGEAQTLRVRITESDGVASQRIADTADWDLTTVDLTVDRTGRADAESAALDWMRQAQARPIDPGAGAPFEFALLRTGPRRHIWFQRYHHAVLDGLGMSLLERRVAAVYTSLITGAAPAEDTAFGELGTLVDADTDYRASEAFTADREFWAAELADAPSPVTLGDGQPTMPSHLARHTVHLGPDALAEVRALAREAEASWPAVLVAALGLWLSRQSGTDDVVLGMPVAARPGRQTRDVPGMASNIVPLRLKLPVDRTVGEMLTHTGRALRTAVRHQRYRYEDLRRDRKMMTDDTRLVGPHVNIVLADYVLDFAGAPGTVTNLAGGPVDDLSLVLDARCPDGGLDLVLDANPDRYDPATRAALTERLAGLVRELAATTPDTPVATLAVLTAAERRRVLHEWNEPLLPAADTTLVALLDAQAAATPDAIAVRSGDRTLTYAQLHARANRLARLLVERGVGPEQLVAVCLPRTEALMVALLAVLKAGGAYLPVDPGYPADRIAFMLADAAPVIGLTSAAVREALPATDGGAPWLDMDSVDTDTVDESTVDSTNSADVLLGNENPDPAVELDPANTAYVIYTSGSTGRPKGVLVSHSAVAGLVTWAGSQFGPDRLAHVLAATSLNFDVSVFELFGPLCCGGSIELVRDLLELAERPDGWSGSLISAVPSALAQLLTAGGVRLRAGDVVLAGEGLSLPVAQQIQNAVAGARVANIYGPTEDTVYATAWYADGPIRSAPPIGAPLPHTRGYVLDAALRLVAPGAVGELYLAGGGVARGYLGRPELTSERFVADPYGPAGARMYRTGDVVRWNADGEIVYLGRADDQVKVRGFRIELGEIETVLARRPELSQVAVVVREDQPGVRQLVGYVVPASQSEVDIATIDTRVLHDEVAGALPEYMVPAAFVVLDRLPLNPNGKLDRRALPAPDYVASGAGRAAATDRERLLCGLYESVLGVGGIGAEDSFFDLGGDSIVAIQLVARAREAGLALTPRQVFEAKTPARLATLATAIDAEPARKNADDGIGELPLTPITHWLRERGGPIDSVHQSVLVTAPAGAGIDRLADALQTVIDHHDALRLRLRSEAAGGWGLVVRPRGTVSAAGLLSRVDATAGGPEYLNALVSKHAELAWRELRPREAECLRAVWFDAGPDRPGRLLLVAHHLLVDGLSWRILLEDLARAWRGEPLPPVGTSLREWATTLSTVDRSAELELWSAQLDTPDPDLGARSFQPAVDTIGTADTRTLTLPESLSEAVLRTIPTAFHTGVQEVLLAGLALAVHRWRTRRGGPADRLLVDVEGHGREDLVPGADISRTVGWFTSLFPLGLDLAEEKDAAPDSGAVLRLVKETLRGLPDHGAGYGILRYLNEQGAELANRRPPQIGFNYLGQLGGDDTADFALAEPLAAPAGDPATRLAHALEINAYSTGSEQVMATVTAAGQLLSEDDLTELLEDWLAGLTELAEHTAAGGGGYTPSDFPLVTLNQQAIDALRAEYRGDFGSQIDVLPLTALQRGLRFHALLDETGADVYTVQFTFDLSGPVDTARLRAAGRELVRRHPNLAAAFPADAEVQVLPAGPTVPDIPFTELDLSPVDDEDDESAALDRALAADRAARFDLARPPLLRMTLINLGGRRSVLAVTNHHILLDGWSMPVLAQELFALYAGRRDLPAATPFAEHLRWLAGRDRAEAEHVWTTELSGVDEPTLLIPAGKGRRAVAPARVVEELPAAELVALTDMARHAGLTLNTVVQGAWGVLLGKLTGRADVTFGATVSGRPAELPGVETMVGLFINTVPVRVRVDEDQTDPAWVVLARLQDAQTGLLAHQHLGLADIQRAAGLDELFDTLTVFENYPLDPDALRLDGTGLAVTNVGGTDATHYPVTLIITAGETLKLRLDYQPEVISASDAELILRRLRRVLAAFVADPAVPVGAIDVLSPAERDQVLHGFNDTAHPVTATTLPAIFAEQAARTPDHAAVVFEDSALSYAELDAAANRLARLLIDRGVGPGRLVALAVPRSLELLVAMYAVHKAGAAYLPIDPDYPADRIEFMLGDADPAVLITTPAVNIEPGDTPTLVLPLPAGDLAGYSAAPVTDADRLTPLTPDHPAYVIYTSGSTGRPKGVLVPHRGIVNRLRWMQHAYPLDDTDRVVQKTPSGFDVSVWEFFWPLQIGATLVVARPEGHKDPLYLAELIDRERITTIHFVPSMLHAFMEALPAGAARGLRRVICSGEALPVELTEKLLATLGPTGTELHNLYGPTEASVDVTAWTCRPGETSVPIGRPVWNTQTYVLDGALNPAPIGVAGELYLAGDQLALGYLGRPALTAQRFVANPYGRAGARMYRTGDIARWRADGALEYLGRADDQVKIRGQRIELGEIETVLAGHPDVTQIAVVAREDTPGTKRLVAYVVGEVEPDALRAFAADTLPEPMVPAAIVAMPALPLTPNGKLDRKALPKPDFGSRTGGRAPATPAERVLAGLFADVLGVAEVSAEDSFFDLGGDSIISIQLVSRARQAGLGLTPRQVFEKRTVADLAAVATDLGGGLAAVTTEAPDAGTGELVPTPIAHWLLDEGGDITTFNQSMLLATPAGLTADWLDTALRTLIDHHDTLRLSVCGETGPGSWTVTVAPRGTEPAPGLLSRVDISTVDAEALTKTLAQEADAARAELDPWAGAVLRAVWFDAGPDRPGRLLLVAHHLVVDGVSWRVLTDDLARLWQGADPQPVGTSYRTWGTLLVEQASQRAGEAELWAEQLGHNGRPLGARPLDPAVDTAGTARTLTIEVPAEHTEALLSDLPTAYHANPQDVLLTALGLAVADWRGEPDAPVVVDVEGHGRADLPGTDTSRTLGWFTTSYPVRLDPVADDTDPANVWDGGPATGAAIKRVKEALRALPDNGLGFGLLRYLNPDTAPALAARPRPEIGFNYLGRLAAPGQPADWAPAPEGPGIGGGASPGMRLPHTIEINAVTQDGPDGPRLSATLLYPTGVLTEQRMRALADRWLAALAALADHARRPDAGGFTPSDLNLVELDQEDIESFEDELTSEWELS